jgi:hypothetical protein
MDDSQLTEDFTTLGRLGASLICHLTILEQLTIAKNAICEVLDRLEEPDQSKEIFHLALAVDVLDLATKVMAQSPKLAKLRNLDL